MPALAQKTTYISKCDNLKETIVWQEQKTKEKIFLSVIQGNERQEYVMNKSLQTEKWQIINPSLQTNLTIELRNNIYSIEGRFKGKSIAKAVQSNGYVWYQNIAFNAGISLKGKKAIKYECFHPDNIKLYTMMAETQDIEKFENMDALKVTVTLTGFLSAFWSCSYYSTLLH